MQMQPEKRQKLRYQTQIFLYIIALTTSQTSSSKIFLARNKFEAAIL